MSDVQAAENADTGTVAREANTDVEARARAQGWRPKDEYRSKNGRPWVGAEEFLAAADDFMPVAKERNRALEERLTTQSAELSAVRQQLGEVKQVLTDFREFATRGEQRAYERALKELMDKRDVAVQHADTETFKQVESDIADLNKTVKAKPDPEPERRTNVPPDPAITAWVAENTWFTTDAELNKFARHHDQYLLEAKPGLTVAQRLAAVKAKTMTEFPDKFENPLREAPSSVSAPNGAGRQRVQKHSYDNLPSEAKRACDKFVNSIPGFTREQYVKTYAWED